MIEWREKTQLPTLDGFVKWERISDDAEYLEEYNNITERAWTIHCRKTCTAGIGRTEKEAWEDLAEITRVRIEIYSYRLEEMKQQAEVCDE